MSHQITSNAHHQGHQASDNANIVNTNHVDTLNIGSKLPTQNIPLAQIGSGTERNQNEETEQASNLRRAFTGKASGSWYRKLRIWFLLFLLILLVAAAVSLGIVLSRRPKNDQSHRSSTTALYVTRS